MTWRAWRIMVGVGIAIIIALALANLSLFGSVLPAR